MSKTSTLDRRSDGDAFTNPHVTPLPAANEVMSDSAISRKEYRTQLNLLQIELVKLQRHIIRSGEKVVILLEGRDAAGTDGSIKRIVVYLSPRESLEVLPGHWQG